jgi:hypothetical protein
VKGRGCTDLLGPHPSVQEFSTSDLAGHLTDLGIERSKANLSQVDYRVSVNVKRVREEAWVEPGWNINTDGLQKLVTIIQQFGEAPYDMVTRSSTNDLELSVLTQE